MAVDITCVHCTVASAPSYFAQVIFNDVPTGSYFVRGNPLQGQDHVHVHGHIRAGRDVETKEKLVLELMRATSGGGSTEAALRAVHISDIPARQIAEYGQLPPNPGDEAAWYEAVSADLRKQMEAISI